MNTNAKTNTKIIQIHIEYKQYGFQLLVGPSSPDYFDNLEIETELQQFFRIQ